MNSNLFFPVSRRRLSNGDLEQTGHHAALDTHIWNINCLTIS
jgi:hypothetical protein